MEKVRIPASFRCAGTARDFLGQAAGDRLSQEQFGDAMLVVSELATNSFRHAGTDMTLTVECFDEHIRIGMLDGTSVLPERRNAWPSTPDGRGLQIIDRLTHRWGVLLRPGGKEVWCELAATAGRPR